MADNCGSYVSADDLQAAKQSILHIEHVATSKDSEGLPADQVTDTIRGNGYTNPTLNGFFSKIGFSPVAGSFEDGATLNERWQVVLYENNDSFYQWSGDLPKVIAPGSSPFDGSGNLIAGWVDQTDLTLRSQLKSYTTNNGDSLIAVKNSRTGSVNRTQHDKNEDSLSGTDFGMSVSSVSLTDTALTQMSTLGLTYSLPQGVFTTTKNPGTLKGVFTGPGVIKGSDGNKRGKYFSNISAPPSSIGDESSVVTAFNGDNSLSPFQIEHRVTGEATLGKPSAGYVYQPETMPNYTYLYNTSGWNQLLNANGGRTGIAAYRAKVDQYGQGDAVAFNASVFIASTKTGSTHFLANPAGVLFNGDMGAGADGIYFNPHEIIMHDNGYDVAAVGFVANFSRSNPAGKKSCIWHGARYQSVGSAACDAILSASGSWKNGIDFTQAQTDFGTNQAAISLKAGQRIYFNNAANASGNTESGWHTTVYNGDYIAYNSSHIDIVAGGNPNLQVSSGQVSALKRLKLFESINFVSAGNVASSAGSVAQYLIVYLDDGTQRKIALLNP